MGSACASPRGRLTFVRAVRAIRCHTARASFLDLIGIASDLPRRETLNFARAIRAGRIDQRSKCDSGSSDSYHRRPDCYNVIQWAMVQTIKLLRNLLRQSIKSLVG